MSKKLRNEEGRVLQIKDEEREEEDKLKLMKERMYAPVVWKRLGIGIRIEDIKEKHFAAVLDVLKECFITDDVLCKNSEMYLDEESTASFLEQCLFQLKDTSSIMAVDESKEKEEIAGTALLRVIHKQDFGRVFSRTMMVRGDAQKKCVRIKTALNRKVDLFETFDCESYLRIYAVCIKPTYRRKGIGFNMMMCALNVAQSMNIPVIMGIFSNSSLQRCAKRLGMQAQAEINYVEWLDKDKNLVFDDPGAGNYTCSLFAGRVPTQPIEEEVKPEVKESTDGKKPKITRQERRELAAKKKK